jgi:ribosomal protein L37AE/L43A
MPTTLLGGSDNYRAGRRLLTSKESFICPNCKKKTLSVDNADSIWQEGISNPELVNLIKKLIAESRMKEYFFWRCKRCNIYYQTDLNVKLLKRFPLRER